MNLIELYIQEVTRRLTEKNREDIALELRSTIEDMLPEDYSDQNVKAVLSKLGNPAVLAGGYSDRPMHLIGPCYYDVYISLLKMILPIAIAISTIPLVVDSILSYNGDQVFLEVLLSFLGEGIWNVFSTGIQVFFWLTLVFALLERTDHGKITVPITAGFKEWTPDDLKDIPYIPKEKAISKMNVFGGLLWTAIWVTFYFNAARLLGIYEKGEHGLEFIAPTFNHEVLLSYWPIVVIVIGLEVALTIYKWITAQWTIRVAWLNAIFQIVSSIAIIVIFSDTNLLNPEFIEYLNKLFSFSFDLKSKIMLGVMIICVFFAALDTYQGFRKARIHSEKNNTVNRHM
ncbi:hypothetical protein KHA94_06965 [Bacillus sp. FJAT-49705]|uniref:Uncharacterized protein n=1 Tax=Cytobacillus citreus TaxID=2833586 RepID=A0ABS5NQ52_9BACI|nr:hypothetical protein [Cytobacillus citreus]MBS4189945.1 hypothetical protein [Cytobacillus citreus]